MHLSDGNPTVAGLIGTRNPQFGVSGEDLSGLPWRLFWTQQHGDDPTWEVLVKQTADPGDRGDQGDQDSQH
jgi:hypothetical protein